MNPTLRQMRAFVALAKTGNFTLAAQAMHVTQSALSGLIKELEQTLGAKVVDRSTRRALLTDIGKELYPLQGQVTERLLDDMHASTHAPPLKPANEVSFMTTALAMAAAGLGVTVCMPYAAPLVTLYGLVMRPLEEPVLTRRFFIYTRPGRSLSPAAESFIDFLEEFV